MRQPFDIQTDHMQLLGEMYALLKEGGTLFFSTNFRKFKLEWAPPVGGSVKKYQRRPSPLIIEIRKSIRVTKSQKLR